METNARRRNFMGYLTPHSNRKTQPVTSIDSILSQRLYYSRSFPNRPSGVTFRFRILDAAIIEQVYCLTLCSFYSPISWLITRRKGVRSKNQDFLNIWGPETALNPCLAQGIEKGGPWRYKESSLIYKFDVSMWAASRIEMNKNPS